MSIDKRKKKLLSSVRTASSLASLMIVSGYVLIILSTAVGSLLFQSDISGENVDSILSTIAPDSEPTTADQDEIKNTSLAAVKAPMNAQTVKLGISDFIASLDWNNLWKLLTAAFLVLWFGYVLRVMSILTETQLIDYQSAG